ncbi:phospho-N-acetylmuramoyl-pentapeptide-transferase [Neorickettsia helminthoeca str. Oregon]|uniref:Phospho-N-acetylmuramoyl-pentapeptide-transferase n=1 Tax=Neorickettsia helminthoeca str. Oregon TaxID=1286528 RepID=X5H4G1_9RICK|nr:phospho-N-acetylmuramoyl-pentapeptide-transferase [Neorickettsia helminthoeca]AHX11563.1 phospho-N-acetylmuramoyl-pentapeptide-transferase [Neorickettsia helminthoeca str. Oregon]
MNFWICLAAFLLPFLAGISIFPLFIDLVKKLLAVQPISEYLPRHKGKKCTPTLGGLVICTVTILGIALLSVYIGWITFPIIFGIFSYSCVGFVDDFTKIKYGSNAGVLPRTKLLLQIIAGTICILLIKYSVHIENLTYLFFPGGHYLDLGWCYYIFAVLFIVGVSNAVNLTDGLDGLAISTILSALIGLLAIAVSQHNHQVMLTIIIIVGAAAAFIPFNLRPAKIFMGDVGSLALGAIIAIIAILLKIEILMIFFGFIFLIEVLSVILQLSGLRLSPKKFRIFRMAPIHHHFECIGFEERKIVFIFWLTSLAMMILGLLLWILL